jgi:hypothetical protein
VAFDSHGVEVSVGICGEQGKAKFAASGSSTMAGSGVTAEACQEWQYLCLKIGSVAGRAGVNSVGGLCRQQSDGQQQQEYRVFQETSFHSLVLEGVAGLLRPYF